MSISKELKAIVDEEYTLIRRVREHLHENPELSFKEKNTYDYVKKELDSLGINYKECEGEYGLVARINGQPGKKIIGFRADMDALPIQEENDVPYCSKVPGVMHACGHDGHTAVLLGLAAALKKHPEIMQGDAVLFFQPAEEQPPGGAVAMVQQGMADDVDNVFALHFQGQTPTGVIYTNPGPIMASSDNITITIHGKGAHAADPNMANDALLAGCNVVCAIQNIVSRFIAPIDSAVISISSFRSGGDAHNILQKEAVLLGTVRCLDENLRDDVEKLLHRVIKGICDVFGTTYTLDYVRGIPSVTNNSTVTNMAIEAMKEAGYDVRICKPDLGGEDFAYFLNRVPGCFMYVGCGSEENSRMYPVHTPKFDIDPEAFKVALGCALSIYCKASAE